MHLGHLAFSVKDIGRSLDFYCRGLGFEKWFDMRNDAGEITTVYVKINEREFLELFPSKDAPGINGGSYKHLCLHVDDIEKELAGLAAKGIAADEPAKKGKAGSLLAWLTDPDGNRLELMQLLPDSLQLLGSN